jgi:hypothetical protein
MTKTFGSARTRQRQFETARLLEFSEHGHHLKSQVHDGRSVATALNSRAVRKKWLKVITHLCWRSFPLAGAVVHLNDPDALTKFGRNQSAVRLSEEPRLFKSTTIRKRHGWPTF